MLTSLLRRHFNAADHSISDIKVCVISSPRGQWTISFIWSIHSFYFCPAWADKSDVHPPPTRTKAMFTTLHSARPPRLLIDLQMTYLFCIFYALLCIVIVSLTWLAYFLSHDYLSYINSLGFFNFLFLSEEGSTVETLEFTIRIGSTVTNLFIFRFVVIGIRLPRL